MTPVKPRVHFSPKHAWKDKDRLVLILLELGYQNHAKEYSAVFNHIHRRVLSREGFKTGMPFRSLTAQLSEFSRGGTGSKLYEAISLFSLSQLRDIFSQQFDVIAEAARRLRINLIDRISSESERTTSSPNLKHRRIRVSVTPSETTVTTWIPNSGWGETEDPYTPSRRSRLMHRTNMKTFIPKSNFLSPMISPGNSILNGQRRPYFLYRAFEVQHGLVSRRFLQAGSRIPPPPKLESRAFEDNVQPHLNRDRGYASPFLSFAQKPTVAIKHAFKRMSAGAKMGLAVFKYDDLKKDAVIRFGPSSGPYLVPSVCKQHELFDLPGSYTGTGEFLLWGSVAAKPITVISGIDTMMIRGIMRTVKVLNFESGARLGKYLPKDMSSEHTELFLYQLVRGYKVAGYRQARKSSNYLDFIRGTETNASRAHANKEDEIVEDNDTVDPDPGLVVIEHGEHQTVEDKEMVDSESDSDFTIIEARPVRPARNAFSPSAWRSDTSEEVYDIGYV